jgi:oligopeptidase B
MTKTSNEIYLSADPSTLLLVRPREENVQYHLDVGDQNDVVMLLSENGGEYIVLETTTDLLPMGRERKNERMSTGTEDDHVITDMDLFRNYHVLYERSTSTGYQRISVYRRGSLSTSCVVVPLSPDAVECGKLCPAGNINFGSKSLRFELESPITSGCIYDFEFETNEVKRNGSAEDSRGSYKSERIFVSSKDGTKVPLSLIYREDEKSWSSWFGARESARPVVLVGYGAYGEPMNLGYDPSWLPLLERGFVLAFAHTRGGGDLGKAWYHAGCRENKVKAIEDFEACANHLKAQWGGPLTAKAFSAGGVLVGGALNRQPGLFDNVVLTNAFVDVYKTMMNPDLFLTPHEWDEYGNPLEDTGIHDLIRSYCPIYNVTSSSNPPPRILLIGTLDDENVPFWNATIFAKKLRDCTDDKDKVFLHIEDGGKHHLGGRRLHVAALELAFIIQNSR